MGKRKIVDEAEVRRWFEEGRTYAWMQAEYKRKYGVDTVVSTWGNFRRTRGLDRRLARNDDLIPRAVEQRHRWAYPLMMLRTEARRRAGHGVAPSMEARVERWLERMRIDDSVVAYDPDQEHGFSIVPRSDDDTDLIKQPPRKTTNRQSADRHQDGWSTP